MTIKITIEKDSKAEELFQQYLEQKETARNHLARAKEKDNQPKKFAQPV